MKQFLRKLTDRQSLTREEASDAMGEIMSGSTSDAQLAAFLIALKLKGEQLQELLGFVEAMRARSIKVRLTDPDAIDLCGTGGDNSGTFNISTAASFVASGAGVTVAKHGNRAISSSCGSADVLLALGVNIELTPAQAEECINTVGIGFLFAPTFHPGMKFAARTRAELGIKTCFNILGPMINPASVERQVVGVFNRNVAETMASLYSLLQPARVCVVCARNGMDEISLSGPTDVYEINGGEPPFHYTVDPEMFGFSTTAQEALRGGTVGENAAILKRILQGERGPRREVVLANTAVALYVAGKVETLRDGVAEAAVSIDSGAALAKLDHLISVTNA